MSALSRRAVPVYLGLLLTLAAVGLVNQTLYRHQLRLIDQRRSLLDQVANLRLEAAKVDGPLAITQWATSHGMVPAPEAQKVSAVAAGPAALPKLPGSGLEIVTIWH